MDGRTTILLERGGDELPWRLTLHADRAQVEQLIAGDAEFTLTTDLGTRSINPKDVIRVVDEETD